MDDVVLNEVPSSLKRLARMVVRGFYSKEHVVIIDMLVRNPCMKDDDLVELLKLERKQMRACLGQLKNDKFLKTRVKMETGPDGKATRQNYFYINYKVFVNVVKYKLDHMRRKIETEERDSTSRASFKCLNCLKSFTDLEVNLLFDPLSQELRCTHCNFQVEEDDSSLPKHDSRLLLAKFNEQIQPMFELLQQVEDIRLAPEILEPEPTDMSAIKREIRPKQAPGSKSMDAWSGDASRNKDLSMEQEVTISFGDERQGSRANHVKKAQPIWMSQSTVTAAPMRTVIEPAASRSGAAFDNVIPINAPMGRGQEEIMQLLLTHEKKDGSSIAKSVKSIIPKDDGQESDTSESDAEGPQNETTTAAGVVGAVLEDDDDEDEEEETQMIAVGDVKVPLQEVTDELINKMTPAEKEAYIAAGQAMYASMYE